MNFFTQEAVVCPHCHAVYVLGRFTRRELGRFSQQIQLRECTAEAAMLTRVQVLFARHPKLQALHAKSFFMWKRRDIKPLEEWLHTQIPESSQWNFTDEDREIMDYLDHHFFGLPERMKHTQKFRRELLQKVKANPVHCRQCGQSALQLKAERLNSTYTWYLRELSFHPGEYAAHPLGCWLFTVAIGLLGVWGLKSGTAMLQEVCALLTFAAIVCVWMLWKEWSLNRKPSVSTQITSQEEEADYELDATRERIFRGRYYSHWEVPHFMWEVGGGKIKLRCELFSARKDGWDWFSDALSEHDHSTALKGHGFSSRDVSAVFDLEFRGVFIGTGQFGHMGLNRYLVEIEDMLSARLVSVDYGSAASDELLRPASGGSETPAEELVRPAEEQE